MLCLERCKGRLVDFLYWDVEEEIEAEDGFQVVDILLPYINQWRTITINVDGFRLISSFVLNFTAAGPAPNLESLELADRSQFNRESEIGRQ